MGRGQKRQASPRLWATLLATIAFGSWMLGIAPAATQPGIERAPARVAQLPPLPLPPVPLIETPKVVIFTLDMRPVHVFDNPSGCTSAPPGSHMLANLTAAPVNLFLDGRCTVPAAPISIVAPGTGAHITFLGAGVGGSFAPVAGLPPIPLPEVPELEVPKAVVFTFDTVPLGVFRDPHGCKAAPAGAHVIANLTPKPIKLFFDTNCKVPAVPISAIGPGIGAHISFLGAGVGGSFSVE